MRRKGGVRVGYISRWLQGALGGATECTSAAVSIIGFLGHGPRDDLVECAGNSRVNHARTRRRFRHMIGDDMLKAVAGIRGGSRQGSCKTQPSER